MIAIWIMLFVCVASSPSCEQGDISVANTSYASSEECYAEGMKRAGGRIVDRSISMRLNQALASCAFLTTLTISTVLFWSPAFG